MEFAIIWFVLWGFLWAAYFVTDGFDLGVGIVYPFLGKSDVEKRVLLNTIGPVWDGNEVWLVTAGGATFAAFPVVYALMFSYLYSALFLILVALIFRGVAFEFREKGASDIWRKAWDLAAFLGSLVTALLFGVAFGNIFQGLPMDAAGYHGSLPGLLNPYGILTGLFFVILFMVHGTLWLTLKTAGDLSRRAAALVLKLWMVLLPVAVLFLVHSAFATSIYANYLRQIALFFVPLLAVVALVGMGFLIMKGQYRGAFFASCLLIASVVATGMVGLYPSLIPSSLDPASSLTVFNSSSSVYTLKIMTVVAVLFVPMVIACQIWVYRVFRQKVTEEDVVESHDAY